MSQPSVSLCSLFEDELDASCDDTYRHTWMAAREDIHHEELCKELQPWCEWAHRDAREYFLGALGLSLHPDPGFAVPLDVDYPKCFPSKTKMGYFGEALCGAAVVHLDCIGDRTWHIPAFLFRFHKAAQDYLQRAWVGSKLPTEVVGRTGDDFLAVSLDEHGALQAVAVGEAKCYNKHDKEAISAAVANLSDQGVFPIDLIQLRELIQHDADRGALITSITEQIVRRDKGNLERIDILLYVTSPYAIKKQRKSRLASGKPSEYTASRKLQIFEFLIESPRRFVEQLYSRLYTQNHKP